MLGDVVGNGNALRIEYAFDIGVDNYITHKAGLYPFSPGLLRMTSLSSHLVAMTEPFFSSR